MSTFRTRPDFGSQVDNLNGGSPARGSWNGDAYVLPVGVGNWVLADEGSYFVAANATVGTGLAGHAAPVVADTDTKALLNIFNNNTTRNLIPDYIFLEVTAAGTAGTLTYAVVWIDNRGVTARASGGALLVANSAHAAAPYASSAVPYFGPVVTTTGFTKVAQSLMREVIPVVQDTILIKFGSGSPGVRAPLTQAGTATSDTVIYMPPVVIPPGGNFQFTSISPSQSAARSYQVHTGWWER